MKTAGAFAPGPLATLLMVAHVSGIDPGAFGGVGLATSVVVDRAGRFTAPPAAEPSGSPSATPVATLPVTGSSDPMPLGAFGVLLVGLGIAALLVGRR